MSDLGDLLSERRENHVNDIRNNRDMIIQSVAFGDELFDGKLERCISGE